LKNKLLRKAFGPKWDKIIERWRKLHKEELHNLHSTPNINRMIKSRGKVGRACRTHMEKRNAYRALVVKPKGKR
jgi:hypothetical protein